MSLENLSIILNKLIKDKNHCLKINEYFKILKEEENINSNFILLLLKSVLMIVSYYPSKINILLKFFEVLIDNKSESKRDLINLVNKIDLKNINRFNNFNSSSILSTKDDNYEFDIILEKMIFNLFNFIELIYIESIKNSKYSFKVSITLINELLFNINKIKSDDILFKCRIFILFIKVSHEIFEENKGIHIYLKIVENLNSLTKLMNNYLDWNNLVKQLSETT